MGRVGYGAWARVDHSVALGHWQPMPAALVARQFQAIHWPQSRDVWCSSDFTPNVTAAWCRGEHASVVARVMRRPSRVASWAEPTPSALARHARNAQCPPGTWIRPSSARFEADAPNRPRGSPTITATSSTLAGFLYTGHRPRRVQPALRRRSGAMAGRSITHRAESVDRTLQDGRGFNDAARGGHPSLRPRPCQYTSLAFGARLPFEHGAVAAIDWRRSVGGV